MKSLLVFVAALALGCGGPIDPPDSVGCHADNDCKGDRICSFGTCIDGTGPDAGPMGRGCNQIDIACNCLPTNAYPGLVASTELCQSGQHQFFVCNGSCYGGIPWGASCYCR